MKKRILGGLIFCLLFVSLFFSYGTYVYAESFVPEEYYKNYHIADEREKLLSLIIEIEASQKVGAEVTTQQFAELHDIFTTLFPYFPSTPNYELIYKQCEITTQTLANNVTQNDYEIFKERCFSPIGDLINTIQTKFTVKATITAKPKQGNAPLNVTFDARGSKDPSSDTIPSENYFWYYRDIYGNDRTIGKGPVVNYTFENPGNHIVHLTVRSSNNITQGIFDGSDDVAINVAPRAANIVVRVNNKELTTDRTLRIGTFDAKKGILIDGTSTVPLGGRTIVEYEWTITSNENKYSFKKTGKGSPGQFLHKFPRNGKYFLTLSLVDNENNKLSEKYILSVSDPVANIKLKPQEGTSSDEYLFDASASYSLSSKIKTYQWLLRDPRGREEIIEKKKEKRKLSIPGTYTLKLTVIDELGNSSYDEISFNVKSTPPLPSFTITPSTDLELPSQFVLDASSSTDPDRGPAQDSLGYERFISPDNDVQIAHPEKDDKKVLVTFDTPGEYTIKLRITDNYGEQVEIEKPLKVVSTLRPQIFVSPAVSKWGEEITFSAKTNKVVAFYERDFGDGKTQRSDTPVVHHTYQNAGAYMVKLHVVDHDGRENTVSKQVFMGQKDMPVVAYTVMKQHQETLQATTRCTDPSDDQKTFPAYDIERYEQFVFDAHTSLNAQGGNTDMVITIHPQNDEVFQKSLINYKFLEVGCHYLDVFVEDTNTGKTAQERVRFNVHNALPTLDNLVLSFPQIKNAGALGIGSNPLQASNNSLFSDINMDPVFVQLDAKGSSDPDGFISHYIRYYYETKNPDNILAVKVTPSTLPHVTFVISKPRYASEYSFAVRMVDNDGAEVTSEELLGKGPVVFFPPGENSLDVPLVTLSVDKGYVKVGDPVKFTTQASILSKRPDFVASRYFKYDFDGDGEYDLTTKKDTVTHVYENPGDKHPKVTVFYKDRAGVGLGEKIIVQKGLKPKILFDTYDNTIIGKDVSIGDIEKKELCLDITKCRQDDHWMLSQDQVSGFLFSYDTYSEHKRRYSALDTHGNEEVIGGTLNLSPEKSPGTVGLLSIPSAIATSGGYEISVGNSLSNSVLLDVVYDDGKCFIDTDLSKDSDEDGDPVNDQDMTCNTVHNIAFSPVSPDQTMRVYYVANKKVSSKDIRIVFLDFESVLPKEWEDTFLLIQSLLDSLGEVRDENMTHYKNLLINLKASLGDRNTMDSLLIQLHELVDKGMLSLSTQQQEKTQKLLDFLSDSDVQEIIGGSLYEIAKTNTLAFFDETTKQTIENIFRDFETSEGTSPEKRKKLLDQIIRITAEQRDQGVLDMTDYNIIQKNLCDVIVYYDLPSKTCGTLSTPDPLSSGTTETDVLSKKKRGVGGTILRVVIIVLVVLGIIFGVVVVFFALKVRQKHEEEDDDEEDDDDL